jgi:hypothetical protein
MRRLRPADWIAGLAVIAVAVLTSLSWSGSGSGWSSLGWAGDVIVALAIAGGLGLWGTIAADRAPSVQVITAAGATVAAGLGTIVAVIDLLGSADARFPAYGATVSLALLTVACWRSMADERTDCAGLMYEPPKRRPAPPE